MKEIHIILCIFSSIIPVMNPHPIGNAFESIASRAAEVFGSASAEAFETVAGRSIAGNTQLRQGLQRSLSASEIGNVPKIRPSIQRSVSESGLLLSNKASVRSPKFLNFVCRNGILPMAKRLIENHGVIPSIETLNMAAYSGNKELVKYLIEIRGIEPERRTLVAATYSKNIELLKYLVDEHFIIPEKIVTDAATISGSEENYKFLRWAHLSNAFEDQFMNQIQNVLGDSAEDYMDDMITKWYLKSLEGAIQNDDFEKVERLIQDDRVEIDYSILDRAAKLENNRIFNLLVDSI